jgi:hypothetical protein
MFFFILLFVFITLVQRKKDLLGYTEPLGILHQNLDLVSFQQISVHTGVVAVPLFGLLHHEVQLDGRVDAPVIDVFLQQNCHHGIHAIPVGHSPVAAVAIKEEQVAQLR